MCLFFQVLRNQGFTKIIKIIWKKWTFPERIPRSGIIFFMYRADVLMIEREKKRNIRGSQGPACPLEAFFCNARKPCIPLGKPAFGDTGKTMRATLMKPVVYWSLWSEFRKNYLKRHGKPLGLLCFLEAFSQSRKSLYSLGKRSFRGNSANHVRNPYKTWRFLIPFGSFPRNMPQEAWKTIRITVFSWGVSTISENLVFLEENQLSEEEEKHTRNPYKPCRLSIPFCKFPRKGAHGAWKTIRNTIYFLGVPTISENLVFLEENQLGGGGCWARWGILPKANFSFYAFLVPTGVRRWWKKEFFLNEKFFSDRLFQESFTSCTSEEYWW